MCGSVEPVTHHRYVRAAAADGHVEKITLEKEMRKSLWNRTTKRLNYAALA